MSDESHAVQRDRPEIVIHPLKKETLQIGYVARQVEGHDLPLAIPQHFVAALKALDHEAALRGDVAFPHDVLIRPNLLDRDRQAQDGFLFLRGKRRGIDVQPSNEPMQRRFRHSPTFSRRRTRLAILTPSPERRPHASWHAPALIYVGAVAEARGTMPAAGRRGSSNYAARTATSNHRAALRSGWSASSRTSTASSLRIAPGRASCAKSARPAVASSRAAPKPSSSSPSSSRTKWGPSRVSKK